jgi:oligopeptidase B
VAKMRALTAGAPATLFKFNLDARHGGASGRYYRLREIAFDYAWLLGDRGSPELWPRRRTRSRS